MRLAILSLTLCAAAPAVAGNNEITIGGTGRSLRTASANAVTSENLGGVQLAVARQIHLDFVPNLQIWGAAGFASTSAEGELFGMPTDIESVDLQLGGRARYLLHRYVAVSARLEVGPSHTALAIEGNGHRVSDGRWGGLVTTALGADLFLFASSRFSVGMRFELGYALHSAPALSPVQATDENMLQLPESQASIGSLDLGGRFWAFSFLSQF